MNKLQAYDRDRVMVSNLSSLIGVDEAGRGALAGPVVAAAVQIDREYLGDPSFLKRTLGVNDSKQLTPAKRAQLYEELNALKEEGVLRIAVGAASEVEVDQINVLQATRVAMQRAVENLGVDLDGLKPRHSSPQVDALLLLDGRPMKGFSYVHEGLVKGDAKSLVIAMASIVAKVTRDRRMIASAVDYPEYGFEKHKGYGTRVHREALLAQGASPLHRKSFLKKIFNEGSGEDQLGFAF